MLSFTSYILNYRSIPGREGHPAMYSPQVRESDIASVQNDEKYKFVIRCFGGCQGTYEQTIDHPT